MWAQAKESNKILCAVVCVCVCVCGWFFLHKFFRFENGEDEARLADDGFISYSRVEITSWQDQDKFCHLRLLKSEVWKLRWGHVEEKREPIKITVPWNGLSRFAHHHQERCHKLTDTTFGGWPLRMLDIARQCLGNVNINKRNIKYLTETDPVAWNC